MYEKYDLIIDCKWDMSEILTLILDAEDRNINLDDIEDNLIVSTNDYPSLLNGLKYLDHEELSMMKYNFETDLNYLRLLTK